MKKQQCLRRPWWLLPLVVLALSLALPVDSSAWSRDSGSSWGDSYNDSSSSTSSTSTATIAATAASTTTSTTTAVATNCSDCHAGTTVQTHHSTVYFTNGECAKCHVGITSTGDCSACHTFGLQNSHHQSAPALAGDCAACHTNVGDYKVCMSCHGGKIQTRHHQIAATGVACRSCHSALASDGSCRSCHVIAPAQAHHEVAAAQNISCKNCHSGIVETTAGCASCHNFKTANPHHTEAVTPYSLTCGSCHQSVWNGKFFETTMPTTAECVECHTTVVGTASIADTHHMTVPAQTGQCTTCHQGVTKVGDCTVCHSTAGGAMVTRHHSNPLYALGNCTVCHVGAEGTKISCSTCHANPPHHSQPDALAGNCKACHTTILTRGSGCASCHTGPVRDIHHGAPLQNVGGNCGACHQSVSDPKVCANCHSGDNPHHTTTFSLTGDCTHCHKVPATAADRPKQAACRECHGLYQHDNGGPIKDFGACAACHTQATFHAAPGRAVGYTRTAPGKGKFALMWQQYSGGREKVREDISPNGEDKNDEGGYKWRTPTLSFNKVQITNAGRTYTVPSFDPATSTPTLADCTRCHLDRKAKVSCTNTLWTAHVTKGYVKAATYQLAETTYLGKLCGGGTTPPPPTSTNLALNKAATASNNESGYGASLAVDGNASTRWWSKSTSSRWLRVDLGSTQSISKVSVSWHSYYARSYRVETSTDGRNWSSVASVSSATGGNRDHTFTARNARYVRIYCTQAASSNGYSINELSVFK